MSQRAWLEDLGLDLSAGTPSHDTIQRVFEVLDPDAFRRAFAGWVGATCEGLGLTHVAIDGKALRGAHRPDETCLHLVSAWATAQRLTLAQVAVDSKSNEVTAIPELLRLLRLAGALVTIDAAGCHRGIAEQILEADADYLLALKRNQPKLYAAVERCFTRADEAAKAAGAAGAPAPAEAAPAEAAPAEAGPAEAGPGGQPTQGKGAARRSAAEVLEEVLAERVVEVVTGETGHGRRDTRWVTVIYNPSGLGLEDWPGLHTIVRVVRLREIGETWTTEAAYYISSSRSPAEVLAAAVRGHWDVENGQHWCLDVAFGEDATRGAGRGAAENLAWVRRVALGLLRQAGGKGSLKTRMFEAAIDGDRRREIVEKLIP